MYNSKIPEDYTLPSSQQLAKSTILALVVAIIVLITIILPAEYGIDPTKIGRVLQLTEMGEIKMQLESEAEADRLASATNSLSVAEKTIPLSTPEIEKAQHQVSTVSPSANTNDQALITQPSSTRELNAPPSDSENIAPLWRDELRIVLTPGEGTEYKLTMNAEDQAEFQWISEGGPINFDLHGNGSGNSISYEKGRSIAEDTGILEAAFTGEHGWFFRNRNDDDIVIIMQIRGQYGEVKKVM